MQKGNVDEGELGDDSGRWVNLQVGEMKFEFGFDMKGERITDIAIVKDVYEKVGEKIIYKV